MTSISVPSPLYRRPTLRVVTGDEEPTFARPFRRRRRTLRSIREQVLCDPLYARRHIL